MVPTCLFAMKDCEDTYVQASYITYRNALLTKRSMASSWWQTSAATEPSSTTS